GSRRAHRHREQPDAQVHEPRVREGVTGMPEQTLCSIRQTSAFIPLSILTRRLPRGVVSGEYLATLRAKGGIPFYGWTVESGALPGRLSLNSFTGAISGTPN